MYEIPHWFDQRFRGVSCSSGVENSTCGVDAELQKSRSKPTLVNPTLAIFI